MADVLRVGELARLKLLRNGVVMFDQAYSPVEEPFTEHAGERVVLAAAMATPQQVNLGGVTTGQHLMLRTTGDIKVGINSSTNLIDVSKALFLVGTITSLYLQNLDPDDTVTVDLVVTD